MKKFLKNPVIKNILSIVAVTFFAFILLNITFLFDFAYQSIVRWIIELFIPLDLDMTIYWLPPLLHLSFVVIIGLISWIVFRSKLKVLYKATYMAVPIAVVLATIGMFLYSWPIISYSIGSLFCIGILYYLYHTKQPWLYYYVLILISTILLIMSLLSVDI